MQFKNYPIKERVVYLYVKKIIIIYLIIISLHLFIYLRVNGLFSRRQ